MGSELLRIVLLMSLFAYVEPYRSKYSLNYSVSFIIFLNTFRKDQLSTPVWSCQITLQQRDFLWDRLQLVQQIRLQMNLEWQILEERENQPIQQQPRKGDQKYQHTHYEWFGSVNSVNHDIHEQSLPDFLFVEQGSVDFLNERASVESVELPSELELNFQSQRQESNIDQCPFEGQHQTFFSNKSPNFNFNSRNSQRQWSMGYSVEQEKFLREIEFKSKGDKPNIYQVPIEQKHQNAKTPSQNRQTNGSKHVIQYLFGPFFRHQLVKNKTREEPNWMIHLYRYNQGPKKLLTLKTPIKWLQGLVKNYEGLLVEMQEYFLCDPLCRHCSVECNDRCNGPSQYLQDFEKRKKQLCPLEVGASEYLAQFNEWLIDHNQKLTFRVWKKKQL